MSLLEGAESWLDQRFEDEDPSNIEG